MRDTPLGPTDPTIVNQFNPADPQNPKNLLGISVEDVASYISLVKEDVGIQHEDELVQAFNILADKIHPLALGNVKRATSQSRMMGRKLLRQKQADGKIDEREIDEIVDKLTSQLYFHSHPINRGEARDEIRLAFVHDASPAEEDAMWRLYEAYSTDMKLHEEFQWLQEVYAANPIQTPSPPVMANPGQLGVTTVGVVEQRIGPLPLVYVESLARTDVRTVEFEGTVRKEWTGEINGNLSLIGGGWEQES